MSTAVTNCLKPKFMLVMSRWCSYTKRVSWTNCISSGCKFPVYVRKIVDISWQ